MTFSPSKETLDVLRQAGYDNELLEKSVQEFAKLQSKYPELVQATDKSFYTHLKTKNMNEGRAVSRRLCMSSSWRPSKGELELLQGEGYWPEIIFDILGDFLFMPKSDIVISNFSFFRAYLRKRYPLEDAASAPYSSDEWTPDHFLKKLIQQHFAITPTSYKVFMGAFLKSAEKRNVPDRYLPRYFFNYVKRNKEHILSFQR